MLSALIHALQCDPCWEVRKAAAWSIASQQARTPAGVLSLYHASKLDPHYLVRDAAADALGVFLVCRRECFKDLFAQADEMVKTLPGKYKPGSPECCQLAEDFLGGCGVVASVTAPVISGPQAPLAVPTTGPEPIPAPRPRQAEGK